MRIPPAFPRVHRAIATIGLVVACCGTAAALPEGKVWTAVEKYEVPAHTFITVPDMITTERGVPVVMADVRGGIGSDMFVLRWADTTWSSVTSLGRGTFSVRAAISPPASHYLIWREPQEIETPTGIKSYAVFSQFVADTIARPDTLALGGGGYEGAASRSRRWAVLGGLFEPPRLLYSETSYGGWKETPLQGESVEAMAVATLDDTTALVTWARDGVVRASIMRGPVLDSVAPPPIGSTGLEGAFRFRRRPSGGYWLSWATTDSFVGVSTFRNGAWTPPDSLRCAYRVPGQYSSQSTPEMSDDAGDYPVVAWSATRNAAPTLCVCVPGDSGFTVAENVEGTDGGLAPVVARDGNGDAWLAWTIEFDGMFWVHTYTAVTATIPAVTIAAHARHLDWTLTGPAPGSWWTVLRAQGGGPFQQVARVRASPGLEQGWTDTMPPEGPLRYKLRRECVDARYRWESEEATWPPSDQQALRFASLPAPFQDGMFIELVGARVGELELSLYDLQGRRVFERRSQASGTGHDSIPLDFSRAHISPGIYFLRARDEAGQVSDPARVVLVR